ncbi:tetratricopeptide (TPR) repeat protein [Paenibacillus sp. SORGH_AS338]|uniref:tetratricopeptide repeat protein n=1 Tax=Paenibacillus sp. SORGH_AS_0338 TaxID=3041755 RepID=UPI00285DA219|nr:tetratricopeptide repeat protein [Paenibacillus sp. SORGH_AS_0338]MDR6109136.1 tetratricopeptide (TPR) repeat protein [Paenibacillus sp. SORGH_AS_0338]
MIHDYHRLMEIEPEAVWIYFDCSWYCLENNDYELTIQYLDQAVTIDPTHALSYNNRGYAYQRLKDYDAALADYSKAIECDPDTNALYYRNRSYIYDFQGETDKAKQDWHKADQIEQHLHLV